MRNGAGWVRPIEEIDHPTVRWNKGNIYLAGEDVVSGVELQPGDSVVFYLYVDGKGLGAEEVRPVWHQHAKSTDKVEESASNSAYANFQVNLSSFFQDCDDDSDSEVEVSKATSGPTELKLADALIERASEPVELPSVGSALHAEGNCKRCSFFPKNNCQNASDCEFCHFDHEKRPKRHKRKNKKGVVPTEEAEADSVTADTALEPMKCDPSTFLLTFKKDSFKATPGSSTPTTDSDECANLSELASSCGSPPTLERDPDIMGAVFLPPPGLMPPPPGLAPPLPMYAQACM